MFNDHTARVEEFVLDTGSNINHLNIKTQPTQYTDKQIFFRVHRGQAYYFLEFKKFIAMGIKLFLKRVVLVANVL